MVTANIFALDQTGSKFYFPEDKRSAILDFASRAWLVPMCAGIEPQLLECFKIDGPPGNIFKRNFLKRLKVIFWILRIYLQLFTGIRIFSTYAFSITILIENKINCVSFGANF